MRKLDDDAKLFFLLLTSYQAFLYLIIRVIGPPPNCTVSLIL